MRPAQFLAPFVVGLAVVVGCSASTEEVHKPTPNTVAHYQVNFPSAAVAATTETVQVIVFDSANGQTDGTDCLSLITKRQTGSDLPAAPLKLLESTPATPCELLATSTSADNKEVVTGKPGALELTYGRRSFLVVTQRGKSDYFLGCLEGELSTAESTITISLIPATSSTVVPTSTCTTLSDRCTNKCM